MDKKEIFDETFDPDRSESYILSVQVSYQGIAFSVNDTARGMHIAYVSNPFSNEMSVSDDWSENISLIFSRYEVLKRKYKRVLFSFESNLFTTVPTDLFLAEKVKDLFELVHPLPNLFEIRFNHLKNSKVTVVFAIPYSITSKWLTYQPNTEFIGFSSALIAYSCLLKSAKDVSAVNTLFTNNFFTTSISANDELKHCNSFNFVNINDAAYYMINFCKQTGLDLNRIILSFTGELDDAKGIELILSQYIAKVNNGFNIEGSSYSYAIAAYKKSNWNLFNLLLCE
ncbi:MAG TPA: hypothetical protein DIW31_12440 [Bacteroidales bacterium]|nr:hypothetical protein [Bacteroidales bacterium]